jgi:hypothetical protein
MNLILSKYLNNNLIKIIGKYNLQSIVKFPNDLIFDIQQIFYTNSSFKSKIFFINESRLEMNLIEKDLERNIIYVEFDD